MINKLSIRSYCLDLTGHTHDYHQLVFPLSGHQRLYIDNRELHVSLGDGAIIYKNTYHQFQAEDKFRFLVMDTEDLPDNILNFPDVLFTLDNSLLSYIHFIDNQLTITSNLTIEESIFQLLMQLLANLEWQEHIDIRLKVVMHHLNENLAQKHSIESLANIACLSPSHFKSLFKQHFRLTPMQYLTRLRMEKAMGLMRHTDLPIYMIAEACGYQDVSAFSRRFLLSFQQSPSQYRGSINIVKP